MGLSNTPAVSKYAIIAAADYESFNLAVFPPKIFSISCNITAKKA
jgi:hypothetical protein